MQHNKGMKNLWIFANNLETEEEMLNNSQLAYHASKVTDTINQLIGSFTSSTSMDNFTHFLIKLGAKHFYYGLSRKHFSVIFIIAMFFRNLQAK